MATITVSSTPRTVVTVVQSPKPSVEVYHEGDSAYDSYVRTTVDDPVKTEAEWVSSLGGDAAFKQWKEVTGVKQTGVNSGTLGDLSTTDDYFYLCVQTGTGESSPGAKDGTAIWKKGLMFET